MKIKDLKKELKKIKNDELDILVNDNCGGGYTMREIKIVKTDQGSEFVEIW